jgi:hypothetical protein
MSDENETEYLTRDDGSRMPVTPLPRRDTEPAERPWRWEKGYVTVQSLGPDAVMLLVDGEHVATLARRQPYNAVVETPPPEAWARLKAVLVHGTKLIQHAESELGTHVG